MHTHIRSYFVSMACLLALLVLLLSAGPVRAAGIRQDELTIPAMIAGPFGATSVGLEALVVRPDDGAPHPLAILSHGSPRESSERPTMSPFGLWPQAMQFARRGWTAVAFMRRGYGRSQGGWAETYGTCDRANYAAAGQAGARDIAAVAKYMATESYVGPGRWIAVGVSAGAFATVALTADAPPGLAAAISFAPGRGSRSSDSVCDEPQLIAAFAQFGKTARAPLLWVSAANDHFFGPRLVDRLRAAFTAGGAQVTFVAAAPFGSDGHMLFSNATGIPMWTPIVDTFLRAQNLTLRTSLIDVPHPTAPTPPGLNGQGRDSFQAYLDSGPNKAFAMGGAHYGWATGRRSPQDARQAALTFCESHAPPACSVVNVNNQPTR